MYVKNHNIWKGKEIFSLFDFFLEFVCQWELITLRGFIGYLSDLSKFNCSEILTYLGLKHDHDKLPDLVSNECG